MKRITTALILALTIAATAFAQVELKDGRVWLNGVRRDDTVWVRSCFKNAAPVTYHFAGRGGGRYGLGSARAWIDEQQALGFDGCRVLLETEGWSACESGAQVDDGKPDNCMFGSEPRDQGFWDVEALRRGGRPTSMHGVGKQTLRWYFETSQETGFLFELVIIATLKHNDVDVGQQTHVVRQTLAEAYRLQKEFPQANILMSAINEWDAHSEWKLGGPDGVNMLAVRADRWKHPDGRTVVGCSAPAGFEPEQWPCGPLIVDGGGGNTFDYDVGPEPGKFDMGAVHPDRGEGWENFPTPDQKQQLVVDSRGQPWGVTEFMYLRDTCGGLPDSAYGRGGWTKDWTKYERSLESLIAANAPYVVIHDEKGVQSVVGWPCERTKVDLWAIEHLAGEPPPPPLPPPAPSLIYDPIIDGTYRLVLARPADPSGIGVYNTWMRVCLNDEGRTLPECIDALETVLFESEEYRARFTR